MPTTVMWPDIALRLALTVLAGALLGINRTERGGAAGLRTTILVCLAAALANIQANMLLSVTGKQSDSFAVMDTLRLPLGILTGVGFIGAGTILRHGGSIQGVTTAATLWVTTMIGLCFGAGEHWLGLAGLALALLTLWGLQRLEQWLPRERRATLILVADAAGPTEDGLRARLHDAGYRITSWTVGYAPHQETGRRTLRCDVKWDGRDRQYGTPEVVHQLAQQPGIIKLQWKM